MHIRRHKLLWGVFLALGIALSIVLTHEDLSAQEEADNQKSASEKTRAEQVSAKKKMDSSQSNEEAVRSDDEPTKAVKDIPPEEQAKKPPQPNAKEEQKPETEAVNYAAIAKNNLFKPLGSGDEKRGPSFRLAGIVGKGGKRHALIEEGNKLYDVMEGQDIASGYRLVSIEDGEIKMEGPDGEASLSLSDWGGSGGGPRGKRPSPSRKSSSSAKKKPDKAPSKPEMKLPSGAPKDMIRKVLEKEGLSLEEVMSTPELQRKLREKYAPMMRDG